jgi:hypothetical protein
MARIVVSSTNLTQKIIDKNMIRIEKLIYIIRDKNINLYGLYLYFSTIEEMIWKYIFFLEFLELFFNGER